ncbi:MAG: type IV pilus twitching motility protein PilT [Myxococcota bacterium]|jgi:twitching motility protein PilT|nr:type IV pilus twitching motility protein PilT [Myxococcota bacterium]
MSIVRSNRVDRFLQLMVERGASDLHFSVSRPPMFRLNGEIEPLRYRTISNEDYVAMIQGIVPEPAYWQRFLASGDLDFAYEIPGLARFRVNLFMQEHGFGAVFRTIPTTILTMEQLALPSVLSRILEMRAGLVLVTGPTGSGKSTTLAAIIDRMNATRSMHIVTIEDPVEFVHQHKKAIISQREIGQHALSFSDALRAAVREDPDLVLVGEMRDLETISLALNAASSGLLVFGTLHTNSAAKTVDRIINVFPTEEQEAVRSVLAECLKCVVAQQLLKRIGGGRCAAVEVMFSAPALPNLIREGKSHQLGSYISSGKRLGMISMDQALYEHVEAGRISREAAIEKALDKTDFRKRMAMVQGPQDARLAEKAAAASQGKR